MLTEKRKKKRKKKVSFPTSKLSTKHFKKSKSGTGDLKHDEKKKLPVKLYHMSMT